MDQKTLPGVTPGAQSFPGRHKVQAPTQHGVKFAKTKQSQIHMGESESYFQLYLTTAALQRPASAHQHPPAGASFIPPANGATLTNPHREVTMCPSPK